MYIEKCCLTHKDSDILKEFSYTNDAYTSDIHPGVDIEGTTCYSVCYGNVISVGHDDDGIVVTVQYDGTKCVRYGHLSSIESYIQVGYAIKFDEIVGYSTNHIHFEYCISEPSQTRLSVRAGGCEWFKADPLHVLQFRNQFLYDDREAGEVDG